MAEREPTISVPRRGLRIAPPAGVRDFVVEAQSGNQVDPLREEQKAELWMVLFSKVFKRRYPNPEEGKKIMNEISQPRRKELLSLADELTEEIVGKWREISPDKEIAVILFGSVATGLVKAAGHLDPSNIDLAVIGNISDTEKERLFDEIREKRDEVTQRIREGIPFEVPNGANAGVHVQHVDKLKANNFDPALEYIKSCAMPLYDPANIWGEIKTRALGHAIDKGTLQKLRKAMRQKNGKA